MPGALSWYAQIVLIGILPYACARPATRAPTEPPRAPVIPPHDASWAKLSRTCPNDAPVRLAPERFALTPGSFHTPDHETAELSRQVPGGYGGLFIGYDPPTPPGARARPETQHVVVFLVDTTQRDAALRAIASATPPHQRSLNISGARIRPARWSFAELYDWYEVFLSRLGMPEGVTITDIQEMENRIVFGVEDAVARERLERQLLPLDLPCFLLGVRIVGREVPR
jgi:hypothetical protein